ncbi:hypothetical protein GH714_006056 [Hevea brasiliensis]|uniref:CCHC-type domain-containing protein n=1 Tax=Hevea brasiliensis TaxID=3981 RepID=A0A6A6M8B9_HEVBR|nr:hypothetical protein GH714_006056 [Hevea brasiliensis]
MAEISNNTRRDDEFKLKMDISPFSGDLDIEGFLNWLIEVNRFFEDDHQTRTKKENTSQDISLSGTVKITKNPASVNNKASSSNPPKTNNPYAKPVLVKCYRCNEMGHRSNEYTKKKSVNIVERHNNDDGEIYCGPDGEDEEEDCEQDESECLMRRSIFIQKIEDK